MVGDSYKKADPWRDKILLRATEKLGLPNYRWHDLRHCCASYMRQDGKSLGLIGKHLGHKSSASTERYSHLSAEETLDTGAAISKRLYG